MDFLLYGLGYLILKFRYKNRDKRKQVLEDIYNNNYLNVGRESILKTIAVIFMVGLLLFLIAVIYSIFRHGSSAY